MAASGKCKFLGNLMKTAWFSSRFPIATGRKSLAHLSKAATARELSTYPAWSTMVDVEQQGEFSVVKMSRPPVNSFSLEFLEELNLVLEDLENDRSCRGIILTSNIPNVFSAGLDLKDELHNPREARLRVFWRQFQEFWLRLYGSKLVSIAAINGHAIAGGCVAALSCDHRVMASGFKIGLTETKVGLALPPMVEDTVNNTIGYRKAELVGSLGMVFSSDEALEMQLVNDVLSQELVMDRAKREMNMWLKIPDPARSVAKQQMRQEAVKRLLNRREEDIDDFVSMVTSDSVQRAIENYIAGLKQKQSQNR